MSPKKLDGWMDTSREWGMASPTCSKVQANANFAWSSRGEKRGSQQVFLVIFLVCISKK